MKNSHWLNFYGEEAAGYDDVRYGSRYGAAFRVVHRQIFGEVLGESPEVVVNALDVASGTGQLVPCVAAASELLVAADLTPEMLKVSRAKYGLPNVVFHRMDAFRMPFADDSFDLVVSSRFLHLFPEEEQIKILREMRRVCRPGGRVIVDFYNETPRTLLRPALAIYRFIRRKREQLDHYATAVGAASIFREAGLEVERQRGVGSYGIAPFLWLPPGLLIRLMRSKLLSNRFLAEQWVLVGRRR